MGLGGAAVQSSILVRVAHSYSFGFILLPHVGYSELEGGGRKMAVCQLWIVCNVGSFKTSAQILDHRKQYSKQDKQRQAFQERMPGMSGQPPPVTQTPKLAFSHCRIFITRESDKISSGMDPKLSPRTPTPSPTHSNSGARSPNLQSHLVA